MTDSDSDPRRRADDNRRPRRLEDNPGVGHLRGSASGWIAFSDRMPEPAYDRKKPDQPTHGMTLVTNAIDARDRWGQMSHVWIVNMVHAHPDGPHVFNGRELAGKGEITAFAHPGGMALRNLTHWRPAVLEEWPEHGGVA